MEQNQEELVEFITHDIASIKVTIAELERGEISPETFFRCVLDAAQEIVKQASKGVAYR